MLYQNTKYIPIAMRYAPIIGKVYDFSAYLLISFKVISPNIIETIVETIIVVPNSNGAS